MTNQDPDMTDARSSITPQDDDAPTVGEPPEVTSELTDEETAAVVGGHAYTTVVMGGLKPGVSFSS
jgi:hypothetical protein